MKPNRVAITKILMHFQHTFLRCLLRRNILLRTGLLFLFYSFVTFLQAQVSASFTTDVTKGCAPLSVTCSTTGNQGYVQYSWTASDGQTSTEQNPSFVFIKPGRYLIKLKVSDNASADSSVRQVFANGIPASFTYDYTNICTTPVAIQFHAYDTSAIGNYHWNFGDSTVSILTNPEHSYALPGVYSVHLVTFSSEGCVDSSIRNIEIGTASVDFAAPSAACSRTPVFVASTSTSIPKTADWSVDGVSVSSAVNGFTYTLPDAGVHTIRLTENFGGTCVFQKEKQITILQRPTAAFGDTGILQSCIYPSTVGFINQSQDADSYAWSFGDSVHATETSPTYQYTRAGQYSPQLIAKNADGCADTLVKSNLILLGPPVVNGVRGIPVSHCLPYTIQPQAFVSTPEPIVSYDWNFGNGDHSTDSLPSYTYTKQGLYNIILSLTTIHGCTDTFVIKNAVQVGDSIVPDFTVDKMTACGSDSFHFTASLNPGISTWIWNFGDGTYIGTHSPSISHKFLGTGNRTVSLSITNSGCAITTTKNDLLFIKPPIAHPGAKYDCTSRLNVTFLDSSQGAQTWLWNFGDGSPQSTEQNPPVHTYPGSNFYTVTLITTNGDCTSTDSIVVPILNTKPVFTFNPADGFLCRKAGIYLSATNPEYIADYFWDFGDGRSAFSDTSIYNYYDTVGTYYPSLVAKYKNGCFDTLYSPTPIRVTGPTASFAALPSCLHDSTFFADKSYSDGTHDIVSWFWDYGDGNSQRDTAAPFMHTYALPGSYAVKLIVTDNNHTCTDTAYYTVRVNALPDVSAGRDTFNCEGSPVQLQAGGAVSYAWDADPTLSCTACVTTNAMPTFPTQYYVTGTDANQCKNRDSVQVEVIHPFRLLVDNASLEICQTKNVVLHASGAQLYSWSPAGGLTDPTIPNPYASPDQTTLYTVTGTDTHHCFTQTGRVNVIVHPNPQFHIMDSLLVVQKGDINTLGTTGSEDIVKWNWSPPLGLSCTNCPQPVSTALKTTTYTAVAYNTYGCTDTDKVTIHVLCNQNKVYIPTAFTPNGDGRNDWFYVLSNIDNPIRSFAVYSRSGELLFTKTNLLSNNPSQGWDGTKNGLPVASGTYVYRIEIQCNEERVPFTGTITVIR